MPRPGRRHVMAFMGHYRFLSNFYPSPLTFEGRIWPSVEHAYQAAKTTAPGTQEVIRCARTPGEAKRLGREVGLRPDWEAVKMSVMARLLELKFQDPELRAQLLATKDWELVEGNTWHDRFWGVCMCDTHHGRGDNHLGQLLMALRDQVRRTGGLGS